MKMRTGLFAFLVFTLTSWLPASATVVISSEMSLQADARASSSAAQATDIDSSSQGATINPLTASVLAVSVAGTARVETFATADATWANASEGNVQFSDVGWSTTGVSSGLAATNSGLDWEYVFQATGTGLFTLDYSIATDTGTTDSFGLNGFSFLWDGPGGGDVLNLDTAGTITRSIVAGTQYTVRLRNSANIAGGLGARTALMDASFNWDINAASVPEPSIVALLGIGLAGISYQRKRIHLA
jgi:hypothetical protein